MLNKDKIKGWRERFRDFYFNYNDADKQVYTKRAAVEAFIDLLLSEEIAKERELIVEKIEGAGFQHDKNGIVKRTITNVLKLLEGEKYI